MLIVASWYVGTPVYDIPRSSTGLPPTSGVLAYSKSRRCWHWAGVSSEPHPQAFMYRVVEPLLGTVQALGPLVVEHRIPRRELEGAVLLTATAWVRPR